MFFAASHGLKIRQQEDEDNKSEESDDERSADESDADDGDVKSETHQPVYKPQSIIEIKLY